MEKESNDSLDDQVNYDMMDKKRKYALLICLLYTSDAADE